MCQSVAEAARVLADWKPSCPGPCLDTNLVRWFLNEKNGFRTALLARLRWACKARPDIYCRFPINPRLSDNAVDENLLADLAQEVLMLLLDPAKCFGSENAFGVLRAKMESSGAGDWSDAQCLVFLLGKKGEHYRLPRPGTTSGACPAIWRWVAMKWRQMSQEKRRSHATFRQNVVPDENTANQKVVARYNGSPLFGVPTAEEGECEFNPENAITEVQQWPDELRMLLAEALRPGSSILKAATVERLRSEKYEFADGVAKCFSISAVCRFLGVARTAAEAQVRELSERLLAIPIPIGQSSLALDGIRESLVTAARSSCGSQHEKVER